MTITRIINGKRIDIKLTDREMYDAFTQYRHECDVEDIMYYIEEDDETELTAGGIDRAAYISRKYQDANDNISECLWLCVEDAIKQVKGEST